MRPASVSNRIGYYLYAFGEVHFVVLRMGFVAGWIEALAQDLRYAACAKGLLLRW
jgi:hypothetical protein